MANSKINLRQKIKEKGTVWAAGAFDALSARFIDEAGFDALLTSGFGISSSFLGQPDAELYTMTENLTVVRNVVNAVTVPVIADIDTAYGNAINVLRTVREFQNAGAAAVIMEDQVAPKRCPASSSMIDVISIEEGVAKIEAAVSARTNPDMLIIARTDAVSEDEAIRRAKAYAEAGADVVQPISRCFKNIAGIRKLRAAVGVPLSLQILGWLERDLSRAEIEGVAAIATFPLVPLMTAAHAMRENLNVLAQTKSSKSLPRPVMDHNEFSVFIGFPKIEELQNKYLRFLPSRAAE